MTNAHVVEGARIIHVKHNGVIGETISTYDAGSWGWIACWIWRF